MIINDLFTLIKSHKWTDLSDKIISEQYDDLNIQDSMRNYLLTYAVIFNKVDICHLLIKYGASIDVVDNEHRSLLCLAIKYNYIDIVKLLLDYNVDNIGISLYDIRDKHNNVATHYAINNNNIEALNLLLSYGANPNISDSSGYNSLHMGVYSRSYDICKTVLEYDIDINAKCSSGESALHIACNLQLTEIAKLLISKHINVNIQDHDYEYSALHYCVNLNNRELINILLNNDADPNLQDMKGNTALHYVSIDGNIEGITALLTTSVFPTNCNLWNIYGCIPLHYALRSAIVDTNSYLQLLLPNSNLNIQDMDGSTCLHIMCEKQLWQKYYSLLATKRLDIFIRDKKNMRPIDYVNKENKEDFDNFFNLVTESYIYKLRLKNITEDSWVDNWENLCKKELMYDNLPKEDRKLIEDIKMPILQKMTDVCPSIIKSRLKKLYNAPANKICGKSYPVKKGNICIKLTEGSSYNICTFTGSTLDTIIGLLYLLHKYPDTCSTLSSDFKENTELCDFYKSIGIITNSHCEFLNFEIVWVNQKLFLNKDFIPNFKKCMARDDKRYIIIPIGIELLEGGHANYLIYDKETNELERFEPHGSSYPYGFNYNPNLLDKILHTQFLSVKNDIKYVFPKDYLPKIGFQLLDITEKTKRKIGDPSGYCSVWAIWYVDIRLSYRDTPRKFLVEKMIQEIKSQNISFKNLIRNYAKNIIDQRDKILSKAGIDINDWLNDQIPIDKANIVIECIAKDIESVSIK